MQSRYSAYVLNFPNYIVATTHPGSPQYQDNQFLWKRGIAQFSKGSQFERLEVLSHHENDRVATIVFTAYLSQNGRDATFTEMSFFEKFGEKWFYRNGLFEKKRAMQMAQHPLNNILPIAYYGEPILHKRAEDTTENLEETEKFIAAMIETMDSFGGIGLAAPQVYHSKRIFIIRPYLTGKDKYSRREATGYGEPHIFINPKMISLSKETWVEPEGCLSIPTVYPPVERAKEIVITYTTLAGKIETQSFDGWPAKQIQHEYDHIEGVLTTDRATQKEKEKIATPLAKLAKRLSSARG